MRHHPLPRVASSCCLCLLALSTGSALLAQPPRDAEGHSPLPRIGVSDDGTHFVTEAGDRFVAWGFNYDHDRGGRLLEDYWVEEWEAIESDFTEMKALGANVVRIHLQLARFMKTAQEPDAAALEQLARLVALAESNRLYLDLTGLGCYHADDVPEWYDALPEAERWSVQAAFWEAVAKTCSESSAIFCYDLMNEPILPGRGKPEKEWLAGELAGKHFVQRITLDLKGRSREEVATAWLDRLTAAIRRHDELHLITVGVIPWAYTFPGSRPIFYSPAARAHLDFVSVHFYPERGQVPKALETLRRYELGKPLVIEEIFPLKCGIDQLADFVEGSREICDGWIGFYWGQTIEELAGEENDIAAALTRQWLEYFREQARVR